METGAVTRGRKQLVFVDEMPAIGLLRFGRLSRRLVGFANLVVGLPDFFIKPPDFIVHTANLFVHALDLVCGHLSLVVHSWPLSAWVVSTSVRSSIARSVPTPTLLFILEPIGYD